MKLTKEQITAALAAGIAITDAASEATVPMRHAAGMVILHELLLAIAEGKIALNTVDGMDDKQPPVVETRPTRRYRKKQKKKKA